MSSEKNGECSAGGGGGSERSFRVTESERKWEWTDGRTIKPHYLTRAHARGPTVEGIQTAEIATTATPPDYKCDKNPKKIGRGIDNLK